MESLPCAPAGVVGNIPYQELTPGESADCVLTNTCALPPQAPTDNLVGAVCSINGFESPCYPAAQGCPAGEVPATDQGGQCTTGQCCVSPQCTAPNQFCGSTCTNLQTDPNNCGTCGNACPVGGACSKGECVCASDGQPVVNATPWPQTTTMKTGKQSVDTW